MNGGRVQLRRQVVLVSGSSILYQGKRRRNGLGVLTDIYGSVDQERGYSTPKGSGKSVNAMESSRGFIRRFEGVVPGLEATH